MRMSLTFSLKLKTVPGSGPRAYDKLPVDQHSTSVLPNGTARISLSPAILRTLPATANSLRNIIDMPRSNY